MNANELLSQVRPQWVNKDCYRSTLRSSQIYTTTITGTILYELKAT